MKKLLIVGAVLVLGGCVTAPENPLTDEQVGALGVRNVEIVVPATTSIHWGEEEEAYAEARGCKKPGGKAVDRQDDYSNGKKDDEEVCAHYDELVQSPEAKSHLRNRVRELVAASMSEKFVPNFQGTRPVDAEVRVRQLHIVSAGQAVMVGGAHMLTGDLVILDAETGAEVVRYPNLASQGGYAPGGLLALVVEAASGDPVERLADGFATQASTWLEKK